MKRRLAKTAALFAVITILLSFTACNDRTATGEYFDVFGTTLYIEGYSAEEAQSAADAMREAELLLSADIPSSDVGRINSAAAGESVTVSGLTMTLLLKAREVYLLTDGAYDPSVYPLVELWGFAPGDFVMGIAPDSLPTDGEIAAASELVGFDRAFSLDADALTVTKLTDGAKLDLGGIAKGYAAQNSLAGFSDETLVNLGGNIGGVGRDYTIGIGAPREYTHSYIGTLTLHSGECVSTSGDYERYYFFDGVRYHHIIDPSDGRPADSGLISVTVVCRDGALGDALSTAIVVAGEEKGREWLDALSADHPEISAVFVDGDMNVSVYGRGFSAV